MSEHPIWQVGNRLPSITDVVEVDGVPQDLSGKSAKFKAREFGSNTLLVDQPVSNALGPNGVVQYDWSQDDIDPGGALAEERDLLVWWEIKTGTKTQDTVGEAVVEVRAHAPTALAYIELEEFKATTNLTGQTFGDLDIRNALVAASRGIDNALGQRFYPDPDANQIRYYTPRSDGTLKIDPLITFTELATSGDGGKTFDSVWVQDTDFVLEPRDAVAEGIPWNAIRPLSYGSHRWPRAYPETVRVKGKFGWPSAPPGIRTLTSIVALRLVQRSRMAPFGIIAFGGDGAQIRAQAIASDPEYQFLTSIYNRKPLFV